MFKFKNLVSLKIALILTVSACTNNPNATNNTSNPSNPETTATKQPSVQETPKTKNQSQKSRLALSTDGIITVKTENGSSKSIKFNSELAITQTVVTAILGEVKQTSENSECPAGKLKTLTWPNGFSIIAAEDKFVGWSITPNTKNPNMTTMTGISIGSTVKDLQAAYNIKVFDSSLGVEFNVDKMSGVLSKNAPDGVITNLWAGTNCIFR